MGAVVLVVQVEGNLFKLGYSRARSFGIVIFLLLPQENVCSFSAPNLLEGQSSRPDFSGKVAILYGQPL